MMSSIAGTLSQVHRSQRGRGKCWLQTVLKITWSWEPCLSGFFYKSSPGDHDFVKGLKKGGNSVVLRVVILLLRWTVSQMPLLGILLYRPRAFSCPYIFIIIDVKNVLLEIIMANTLLSCFTRPVHIFKPVFLSCFKNPVKNIKPQRGK